MTPEYKIKKTILLGMQVWMKDFPEGFCGFKLESEDEIDETWDFLNSCYYIQDSRNEFRRGTEETEIPCGFNRHYETDSVAAQMFDGSWVGWTYWYGGGKHGEPEAIDWMEYAYDLNCEEKEVTIIQRTFTRIEE
jgi:hypothetical protein